MSKTDCPVGQMLDFLLNLCVPDPDLQTQTKPEPEPPTEPTLPAVVPLKATNPTHQADLVMVLSPALWIFVVLATVGSIVALALWFVIYKRQSRLHSTSGDAELQHEPLQKTEPILSLPSDRNTRAEMLQRAAGTPSSCPHLHLAQTGSKWEEGFSAYRDPAKHAGTEGAGGLPTCSTVREHRIPLPATELGGTALVTTKTV